MSRGYRTALIVYCTADLLPHTVSQLQNGSNSLNERVVRSRLSLNLRSSLNMQSIKAVIVGDGAVGKVRCLLSALLSYSASESAFG